MTVRSILAGAALAALAATGAQAGALTVFNVGAPNINCVFNQLCKVVVGDSADDLTFTPLGSGAFVQSRTYTAAPGTPAAGFTAYEYRIDLRNANKFTDCLAGVVINFGPVPLLPIGPNNAKGHVFVVTQGGLGSVGLKSAEQDGDVITFTFEKYLCPGATSYFFGLAAGKAPVKASATMFGLGAVPFIPIDVRVPQH
jgi:hypothetical protein